MQHGEGWAGVDLRAGVGLQASASLRALWLCRTRPRLQIIWVGEAPDVRHSATPELSPLAAGGLQVQVGKSALLQHWLSESFVAGTDLPFLLPLLRNKA